jgi:aminopeptidase N
MKKIIACLSLLFTISISFAQYTHDDTLRGSNGPGRNWWDVIYYAIAIHPDFENKTIEGSVNILFKTKSDGDKTMQIDLQEPLTIDKITFENINVAFRKTGTDTWSVYLKNILPKMYMDKIDGGNGWVDKELSLVIYYHGKPKAALNPPWNGGLVWKRDEQNRPWITIACQGLGASVWYPCKDYQADEPDNGATLSITVPDTLLAVANGRLKSTQKNNDRTATYNWEVKDPINNYDIIPYIGNYVNFNEVYKGTRL